MQPWCWPLGCGKPERATWSERRVCSCVHTFMSVLKHTHVHGQTIYVVLLETATLWVEIERSVKRESVCHATPTVLITHVSAKFVGQQKFCTDLQIIVWLSGKCLLSCWDQRITAIQQPWGFKLSTKTETLGNDYSEVPGLFLPLLFFLLSWASKEMLATILL